MGLVITLPHPAYRLGANGSRGTSRGSVFLLNKLRQEARATARAACLEALQSRGIRSYKPAAYFIEWRHWGAVKPDVDNVVARLKSYLDGCAEALGLDDRHLELAGVSRVHAKNKLNKGVTIFFLDHWQPLVTYKQN